MTRPASRTILAGLSLLLLCGCSKISGIFDADDEKRLTGERISVLELEESLEPDNAALEAEGLITPQAWKNEFWPQAGGYPNHSMQNLALSEGALTKSWSASIGKGTTDRLPLTAQPIVVDGQIYTLDTRGQLSAFDAKTGKTLWTKDVSDPDEGDPVIGGGIAYAAGILYVTNGYRELIALQPAKGEILWRKNIGTPSRAAPTILDGRAFVITIDNRLLALNAADGTQLWEYTGLSENATLVGAASPAASRDIVIPAFSSGELMALRVENGSVAWGDNLSSVKRAGGLTSIADIKALPVIDKNLVIAVSFGGKLVAIDIASGQRVWQRDIGSTNTPWVAGNHIFVLSTENNLVAVGRDTGAIRWVTKLQSKDGEPVFYAGPVFAGGRLFLAGSNGYMMEIDPQQGKKLREWEIGGAVTLPPVIAGGVMYVLSENGTLTAYK
jgi:outer membrane protein assembly factor BamB